MDDRSIPFASQQAEAAFARAGLTPREREASRSVLAGMTADTASSLMGISASSVASYRRRSYEKLGVRNAAELMGTFAPDPGVLVPDVLEILRGRGLNETQANVLALIATGRSTAEIATQLHVAEGTVSSARAHGYQLLRIHSKAELADLLGGKDLEVPDQEPPSTRCPRHLPAILAIAAAVMATALVLGMRAHLGPFAQPHQTHDMPTHETPYGRVPDVVGLDYRKAQKILIDAGFYPKIERAAADETNGANRKGVVIYSLTSARSQNDTPADAATSEEPDHPTQVTLGVAGVSEVPANAFVLSLDEYIDGLRASGFSDIAVSWADDGSNQAADMSLARVSSVSPEPGTWETDDTPVSVTATRYTQVPLVEGMTPVEATGALLSCGLVPSPAVYEWPPEGVSQNYRPLCIWQSIDAGEKTLAGSTVELSYTGPIDRMPDDWN